MSAAHLHLALNHIPIIGTLLAAALLAYGRWREATSVQTAALGLLVGVGAVAGVVYLTGEPAEEIVEGVAGVSHDAIEAHEQWGWYSFLLSALTGLAALGVLLYRKYRRSLAQWPIQVVLSLALITGGLMVYTADLGGKVHHPEMRAGAPNAQTALPVDKESHEQAEEQEDYEEDM